MSERTTYKKNFISYNEYVEGNAVRKEAITEVPQREERTYVGEKRVKTSRAAYRNREKALQMSAAYVAVLAVCIVLMVMTCARYLSLKNYVAETASDIADKKVELDALKAKNDDLEYKVSGFMNVEYISQKATEELGMIRAGKDQISFYKSSESEYMKQFKEIPD